MKYSEIINLSDADLQEELEKQSAAYTELKWTHAVAPLENPSQLTKMRKSIARLNTEIAKRNNN